MILVDISVWIDHLRQTSPILSTLLDRRQILAHPFVIGKLALGTLKQGDAILDSLRGLHSALVAAAERVGVNASVAR